METRGDTSQVLGKVFNEPSDATANEKTTGGALSRAISPEKAASLAIAQGSRPRTWLIALITKLAGNPEICINQNA